jgi:hyperosmotically inducible protein
MFTQYSIQAVPPIHIIVQGGKVTLVGVVNTQMERMKAEMIARSTFGVFGVENKLRVER